MVRACSVSAGPVYWLVACSPTLLVVERNNRLGCLDPPLTVLQTPLPLHGAGYGLEMAVVASGLRLPIERSYASLT